ncbi:hypothetical protein [Methylorubrum sp. POS3]|uniref:hypothetical protein n=1 Tax=Methylorubrum sp. POS3 TaxID=2998492 RepID=UPI00372CC206
MYFDMRGADFFRVQSGGGGRIADPLDPNVLFSGSYEDGQGLFFQQEVAAPGVANGKSYTIDFGRTFTRPPMTFGGLKLTQPVIQNNATLFNAGEYIAPCALRRTIYGRGPVIDYRLEWIVGNNALTLSVAGFTGTFSVFVLEVA